MKGTDRYRVEGVTCRVGDQTLEVVNLSVSGLFAASTLPPELGAVLSVELRLPERPPIPLATEVRWINSPERPRRRDLPPGVGLRIRRIAFPDKMAILSYLKELRLSGR